MKTLLRMFIFSGLALYLTSMWDKGFIIKFEWVPFIETAAIVAVLYYIVRPITKIVLLPFNFLTFGLLSIVIYSFLFYFFTKQLSIVSINAWVFPGLTFHGLSIPKTAISQLQNIVLSSFSVSFIITVLEKLL